MLSNNNHIDPISLDNYEEYFILYLDNELSVEQRQMVEDFVSVHPGLKGELEVLVNTKLLEDKLTMPDKENLLSGSMQSFAINENVLLYLDDELNKSALKDFETELSSNSELQRQLQWLRKTKLDPSEIILFPDKQSLYHSVERRLSFTSWMRVAAVLLVLLSGMAVWLASNRTSGNKEIASVPRVQTTEKGPGNKVQKPRPAGNESSHEMADVNARQIIKPKAHGTRAILNNAATHPVAVISKQDKKSLENEQSPNNDVSFHPVEASEARTGIALVDLPVKTNSNLLVTSTTPMRITDNAAPEAEPVATGTTVANKGSIKSFFRKAARVIEKKTGINPTTNDDELLIGALAVKLK